MASSTTRQVDSVQELKPPLDLSHHFSRVTKARVESKLKQFYKYFQIPGIGNLAGGLPNDSYFPFDTLEAAVALPDRWQPTPNKPNNIKAVSEKLASTRIADSSPESTRVLVPHGTGAVDPTKKIDLNTALQYGQAYGYPPLYTFVRQFTRENLHPNVPYVGGPEVALSVGATDGFAKAIECFSNVWSEERDWIREREGILVEEFAYMNAIQTCRPRGLQVVPVKIDSDGLVPNGPGGLEDVLANWDFRIGKRPHLLYTVSIGQNPTGVTIPVARRKQIYDICSKYDIIIVEDDPYWYIQFPSAAEKEAAARGTPYTETHVHTPSPSPKSSGFEFLDSLVPSYLSVDVDGRVVRLDTFSKTVAPGCRLGWITAAPAIIERILRITENSTQQPSGFVQAMIAEMIIGPQAKDDGGRGGTRSGQGWEVDGWVRWLEGLRGNYERRMTRMCTALEEGKFSLKQQTPIKAEEADWAVVTKTKMYEFDWPRGGMFVWIKVLYDAHPLAGKVEGSKLANALWLFLTTKPYLVLVAPGTMFSPVQDIADKEGWKYFRMCFAAVTDEEVQASSVRFAQAVADFWKIKDVKKIEELNDSEQVDQEGLINMTFFGC